MRISKAEADDLEILLDIWLRSVRASHRFLTEEDIQSLLPLVRDHALVELEVWVFISDTSTLAGFMGLEQNKVEALFIAPEFFRQGGGSQLVRYAKSLRGRLLVDVNEQNPDARIFYEAMGFIVESRSELDSSGRPFPILHMTQPSA